MLLTYAVPGMDNAHLRALTGKLSVAAGWHVTTTRRMGEAGGREVEDWQPTDGSSRAATARACGHLAGGCRMDARLVGTEEERMCGRAGGTVSSLRPETDQCISSPMVFISLHTKTYPTRCANGAWLTRWSSAMWRLAGRLCVVHLLELHPMRPALFVTCSPFPWPPQSAVAM